MSAFFCGDGEREDFDEDEDADGDRAGDFFFTSFDTTRLAGDGEPEDSDPDSERDRRRRGGVAERDLRKNIREFKILTTNSTTVEQIMNTPLLKYPSMIRDAFLCPFTSHNRDLKLTFTTAKWC